MANLKEDALLTVVDFQDLKFGSENASVADL